LTVSSVNPCAAPFVSIHSSGANSTVEFWELDQMSDKTTELTELKNRIQQFIDERDWGKYHNPKDVAVSISIEAAELLELFQWVGDSEMAKALDDPSKLVRIKEELADVIIYCLDLATILGIDVSEAVVEKIEKNAAKYPVEKAKGEYRKYTEL